jgi:hypothetical protein
MLRRIFGPKEEDVIAGWKRLHDEEHHNLYSSPNNIMAIKSRRTRWAELVAHISQMRSTCRILVKKSLGKMDLGVDRRIISKCILEQSDGKVD